MTFISANYRRWIAVFLLIVFCGGDLAWGVATAQAFSIKDEREYGQKMLAVIRSQFTLLDEPDISQYINNIGNEIITIAGNQFFTFHFYVINNREFNAFAAPSGLIFMHSGLLEAMDNEGELVSVLAHEVGHVTSRHIAGRLAKSSKITATTLAMMLAGLALGGGALTQALITGGLATGQAMSMAFSRQDEEEADRRGYEYMLAMHRDPQNMVRMLRKMYQVQQLHMGKLPQYMLTHPNPDIRMGYVQDLIHSNPARHYPPHDQFAFQRIKCRVASYTQEAVKLKSRYLKRIRQAKTGFAKAMARYGLALAYANSGQWDDAEKELRQVMDYFPTKAILKTDLGIVFMKQGHIKKALRQLTKAREGDPGSWYTTFFLAQCLESAGQDKRALALFTQVAGFMPDYPGAYYHMAAILSRQGDKGDAFFYLGKNFFYKGKFTTAKYHFKNARALLGHDKLKLAEITAMEKLIKTL